MLLQLSSRNMLPAKNSIVVVTVPTMAQPFKVDIFSEEVDVASEKPSMPSNAKANTSKQTGRQKQWDSYKTEIIKKKQNQSPKVYKP